MMEGIDITEPNTQLIDFNNQSLVFQLIHCGDFEKLKDSIKDILLLESYLPYLTKIAFHQNESLFELIHTFSQVNRILEYLEANLTEIKEFITSEKKLIQKFPSTDQNFLDQSLLGRLFTGEEITLQFENESILMKIKIVLSDLFNSFHSFKQGKKQYESAILGNEIYLSELCIILPLIVSQFSDYIFLEEVINGLLLIPSLSTQLILSILYNYPFSVQPTVKILIENIEFQASFIFDISTEILMKLCELSSKLATFIRQILFEKKIQPQIILQITMDFLFDEVAFLSSLFSKDFSWFADWFQKSQDQPTIINLRKKLFDRMETLENENSKENLIQIASIIRVWCGLVMLFKLRLTASEFASLFKVFKNCSPSSTRIFNLSLCFILSYKDLMKTINKEEIVSVLTTLLKSSQNTELLLLMAIYFHQSKQSQVFEIIRDTIQIPVSLHNHSLNAISDLFTKEIYPEKTISQKALSLEWANDISTKSSKTPLSLICIFQLVKGRIFNKYQIDPSEWIFSQIEKIKEPIHPMIPSLLEEYAQCVSLQSTYFLQIKLFPSDKLKSIIQDVNKAMCVKVMLLYFVFYFNEQAFKKSIEEKTKKPPLHVYPRDFVDSLPIRSILSYVESHSQNYQHIYSKLISLGVTNYPQLFGVVELLQEEELKSNTVKPFLKEMNTLGSFYSSTTPSSFESNETSLNCANLEKILLNSNQNSLEAAIALEQLTLLSSESLWNQRNIILNSLIPQLLNSKIEHHLTRLFKNIWNKLYFINNWELILQMINLIKIPEKDSFGNPITYSHDLLTVNPVFVLRLHQGVFQSPCLIEILLQILVSYMYASRRHLILQSQILQEDINNLILLQESTIVQQLLEILLNKSNIENGAMEEIRVLICTFLHDLFIETPLMIKLVHFQGYPSELLPITVDGIPSMHICLEFVPELLTQSQVEKQIFGVKLGAHLIEKYPLARSLDLARILLNNIHFRISDSVDRVISFHQSEERVSFLIETLPSLVQLCSAFPLLVEDTVKILLDIMPPQRAASQVLNSNTAKLSRLINNIFQQITTKVLSTE